ncbi:major capsid protein [Chromobacterium haemolyticum]|uniref:major capsid protein n=1 Tax=Chromobacterium haemolyticum TaxID=394935 RepID=UPI000DEF95C9|nr:major capsid protein [Chromobacterium haemolyticum]
MKKFTLVKLAGVLVAVGAATPAFAAPVSIDTGDITSTISAGATAISAIGVAVLSIFALAKCYQLVKKAF